MLKDERMICICSLVTDGGCVCDVGTDHAYVPIELLLSGKCESAVITDISLPSLEKGLENVKKNGLSDKVSGYHCSGTLGTDISGVTDIVIAGMGGELIASIIDSDPRLRDGRYNFILQPMSRAEELRRYLFENGFQILPEHRVRSDGRLYTVIPSKFTGTKTEASEKEIYFGIGGITPTLDREYEEFIIKLIKTKLDGRRSGNNTDAILETENLIYTLLS